MTDRTRRRPSASLAVAILALVVALGGTTYAAVKLPKNSVGSTQIKNRSVQVKDLDGRSTGRLQVKGDDGPTTVTAPIGNPGTQIQTLDLPKGTWLVRAVSYVINDSAVQPAEPRCNLLTAAGADLTDGLTGFYLLIPPLAGNNPSRAQFTLEGTVKVGKGGLTVKVACTESEVVQNFRVGSSMTGLQVVSQDVQ